MGKIQNPRRANASAHSCFVTIRLPLVAACWRTPSACPFHGISTIKTLADPLRRGAYWWAVTNDGFSKEFVVLVGAIDIIHERILSSLV